MNKQELCNYVEKQLMNIFNYYADLSSYLNIAIDRTAICLSKCASKYIIKDAIPFSVFNSAQYCIFLYYLSNTAYAVDNNSIIAEKIYYLNKVLNSVDIFYEVNMPCVFGVEHPLGSVMGRAVYSNKFFFYQGCTVGGNKGHYPSIGSNVLMYSNSKILGNSTIGNNVIIAANTYIKDALIADNSIVFGQYPNNIIKTKTETDILEMTKHIWRHEDD